MPYILDGKTISPDSAFTHDGIQYPAGWLRRVSEESREAIGVYWQPDPPTHDQRFWWGYTPSGDLMPKNLDELKDRWTSQVRNTAGQYLSKTDWLIIRSIDPSSGIEVSEEVLAERELIRQKSNIKEASIAAADTVESLVALVTGSDFNSWLPEVPPKESAEEDIETKSSDTGTIDFGSMDLAEDSITFSAGATTGSISSGFGLGFGEDSVSL